MKEMAFYKIEIFAPKEAADKILLEITRAGAGRFDKYDHCASTMPVTGYWRPLQGAQPFIGREGEISTEPEVKIEINCKHEHIPEVLRAIHENHPYEQPLVNILPLMNELFIDMDQTSRYGP